MTTSEIQAFAALAAGYQNHPRDQQPKDRFHREAKRLARLLAKRLGLPAGAYRVESNRGGIAVCGEVTLHGEAIYVQFCGDAYHGVLFRSCKGRKDYIGGGNRWIPWTGLGDLEQVLAELRTVLPEAAHVA